MGSNPSPPGDDTARGATTQLVTLLAPLTSACLATTPETRPDVADVATQLAALAER